MKKTLSLLMVVIMVIGLIPSPAVLATGFASDDIYMEEPSSFIEFEEPTDPEEDFLDQEDLMPDLPDEELMIEDDITQEETPPLQG